MSDAQRGVERALTTTRIRGIEVHLNEQPKPAEIAVPENCGAMLIWPR